MSEPAAMGMTVDEFLRWEDGTDTRYELVGGFVVGCASGILQVLLPDSMKQMREAFVFGVVILILLVRPQGLVVTRAVQERV